MNLQIPFGVHIIVFDGGLGNQMFEYAFYRSLKRRNPLAIYAFDIYGSETSHYGYELDRVFDINTAREIKLHAFIRKLQRHNYISFSNTTERQIFVYSPDVYKNRLTPQIFSGFWQSEKYFNDIQKSIRSAFTFRKDKLSATTLRMASHIKQTDNTISLHFRRGDYTTILSTQTISIQDYYMPAVEYMRRTIGGGQFVVFSDDILWAKENFKIENTIFVDWNTGEDSWQDMYLMSLCKHNIIANSTFSWWGAWLNPNPNKIVIAPKLWFANEPAVSDIIPKSWIRI